MSESTMTISEQGTKTWRNEMGVKHREDGPAAEWANGGRFWYKNGKRHRLDGPAVEWSDGGKGWYVNGKCHRLNGPAIEWSNGGKEWWINGEYLGPNDEGFWALWDLLTPEQKQDPVLLTYLPGDFSV